MENLSLQSQLISSQILYHREDTVKSEDLSKSDDIV